MSNVAVLEKTGRTETINPNLEIEITFDPTTCGFTTKPSLNEDVHLGTGNGRSITFKANERCVLVIDELFGSRTYVLEQDKPMTLAISDNIGKDGRPSVGTSWSVARLTPRKGEPKPYIPYVP